MPIDYGLQRRERSEDRARVAQARQAYRLARQEASVRASQRALAQRAEAVELRQSGQKRSFFTGRIVPVRASRRARAYTRGAPVEVN